VDHQEFGKYLTQQRELRGMSRDDVSEKTKIPRSVLVALEQGQAERLPERVFVVNYVRAYATVIGMAPEEALLRYEEIHSASSTVLTPVELERRRRGRAWRILGSLVAAAALVAGGLFLWQQYRG
jgi:cytoskeletal protein RodZ